MLGNHLSLDESENMRVRHTREKTHDSRCSPLKLRFHVHQKCLHKQIWIVHYQSVGIGNLYYKIETKNYPKPLFALDA